MFGGVLGDVMGGGKTATTIALIAHSRAAAEKRRTLHENKNANKLGTSNYSQASLVLVHFVVNADEGVVSDMNGVVRGLLDLCQSEHPTVRSRAVNMVGVLIGRA